ELDGKMIAVTSEQKGWISSSDVTSPEKALDLLAQLLAKTPDDLKLHKARSVVAMMLENWDESLVELTDLIRLEPDKVENYLLKANLLRSRGEWEKADLDLEQVLKRDPNNSTAHLFRGQYLFKKGGIEQAIVDLTAAIDNVESGQRIKTQDKITYNF